jgi:hypothetical protein
MYRIVSAVNGQPITYSGGINWGPDETNAMIGKQLRITVTRTEKGEKAYNNITEVLAAKVQLEPIEANNEPVPETAPVAQNEPMGIEKLRAVVQKLENPKQTVQNEPVAPDIAESAAQMASGDANVEDIPF